ncbi:MAG: O-antigen ligase family protein [Frankiaceae bacterium]|nr:O-antigen ligase family protein [Frankiaceae bacterium]
MMAAVVGVVDAPSEAIEIRPAVDARSVAEWSAAVSWLLVLVGWVLPRAWGATVLPVAIAAALPGVLVVRPWRHVRPAVALILLAPAVAALAVAVVSPYGDAGVISLSRWSYVGLLALGTAAFARSAARQLALVAAVLAMGIFEFAQAWLPWWGHEDTSHPMIGQFYSANPFGSAMLCGVLLAVGTALLARRDVARLGFLVAPFCACGVWFSGSRGAILLAAGGSLLLGAIAVRSGARRAVMRLGLLVVITGAVYALLTSSVFFPDGRGESSAAGKSAAGQTVSSTTSVRVDYWRAGWSEFTANPVVGGGSGSYFAYGRLHSPAGAERATLAHNEPLGALAEGGLLLGLPLLAFYLLAAGACLRVVSRSLLAPESVPGVRIAAAVAAGGLLAHSLLDIGLAFPALLGTLGLLIGVSLAGIEPGPAETRRAAIGWVAVLVLVAAFATYVASSYAHVRAGTRSISATQDGPFPGVRDARAAVGRLHALAVADTATDQESALRTALAETADLAVFDGNVQADRIAVLMRLGDHARALAAAQRLAERSRRLAPEHLIPLAREIAAAGDPALAVDLLAFEAWSRFSAEPALLAQLARLVSASQDIGGAASLGSRCATNRFPAGASVSGRLLADSGMAAPRADECEAWSRQGSMAWERATR